VYSILYIKKSSSYVQNTIELDQILTEDIEIKTEEQIAAFLKAKEGTKFSQLYTNSLKMKFNSFVKHMPSLVS